MTLALILTGPVCPTMQAQVWHLPERRLDAFAVAAADAARTIRPQERVVCQRAGDVDQRLVAGLADGVDVKVVHTIP